MNDKLTMAGILESVTGAPSGRPLPVLLTLAGFFILNSLSKWAEDMRVFGLDPGWISLIAIVLVAIYVIVADIKARKRRSRAILSFQVSLDPPPKNGIRGLILLVSQFQSFNSSLRTDRPKLESLISRIASGDDLDLQLFESPDYLDIRNSNLNPNIEAVAYHAHGGDLRDVWLITTETEAAKSDCGASGRIGSESAGCILEAYLKLKYNIHIHRVGFCVKPADYHEIWSKIDEIFSRSGLREEALLVDITGCTKMMTMAAAMACIDDKRRMQYMDAERDWQGQPLSDAVPRPILIDVDPILKIRSQSS